MAKLLITIDGPAGAGKSTVAKALAKKIGAGFLDSGSMYRAVTLAVMKKGIGFEDEEKIIEVMEASGFEFKAEDAKMRVWIDGAEVTEEIRLPEVTQNVHWVASRANLRERIVDMERVFAAKEEKIVTEGRDQGTVAFIDADFKFYITAELDERARRRSDDLQAMGKEKDLETIAESISARDDKDKNRDTGPLKPADDAIMVDTTNLNVEQVVEKLLEHIKE